MRKPQKQKLQQLWKIEDAIASTVKSAFPKELKLYGPRSDEWPPEGDEEGCLETIRKGVVYYCMEDFLWPSGRYMPPSSNIYVGWMGHVRCGEGGVPGLDEILQTPKSPGEQPVSLRTYEDALRYYRAGTMAREVFPQVNDRWVVERKPTNAAPMIEDFLKPYRSHILFHLGDHPSRIAEDREPEIRFVVGAGVSDLFAPPTAAYEHAFRRQVKMLLKQWKRYARRGILQADTNWVRGRLGDWIPDGQIKRYKDALNSIL